MHYPGVDLTTIKATVCEGAGKFSLATCEERRERERERVQPKTDDQLTLRAVRSHIRKVVMPHVFEKGTAGGIKGLELSASGPPLPELSWKLVVSPDTFSPFFHAVEKVMFIA